MLSSSGIQSVCASQKLLRMQGGPFTLPPLFSIAIKDLLAAIDLARFNIDDNFITRVSDDKEAPDKAVVLIEEESFLDILNIFSRAKLQDKGSLVSTQSTRKSSTNTSGHAFFSEEDDEHFQGQI